ncbi:MAG: PKD domain-containing protein, partial [Chitinophagaceae bacterium]
MSVKSSSQYFTVGGEVSYKFLYRSVGEFVFNHYEISIKLYKECNGEGVLPPSVPVSIFISQPDPITPPYNKLLTSSAGQTNFYITSQFPNDCAPEQPPVCYQVGVYTTQIALPENMGDYIIAVQDDQRKSADYANVNTDGIGKNSGGVMGFTLATRIPAGLPFGPNSTASAPVFNKEYPLILCAGKPFRYDFSATDPDGDSLSYKFMPAYQGRIYVNPRATNGSADAPPYLSLIYNASYTGFAPLGSAVQIDSATGMISGTGPVFPGRYLVVVEVSKYRNGSVVGRHRKEITFYFNKCNWPRAQLDSTYRNCSGLSVKFLNYSTGDIRSYTWDFGDPSTNGDISNQAEPTYTYPAPGIYTAKLYLNVGTTACKDSAICKVIVDTGMNASFTTQRVLAACNEATYDFTNTSTEGSNPITSYAWDFGEITVGTDVSSLPNPTYTYPADGNKIVRLIVKNDIGCTDTAFKTISAFKSLMQAPNDTTICNLDTIPLTPNTNGYPGTFSWSPNYRISSLTAPSVLVNPQKDTTYYVSFTDATGCVAFDSVRVKVRDSVKISINNTDTTICKLDTLHLSVKHDGLSVTWQPSSDITPTNPDGSSADAVLMNTGLVIATSHFGSCFEKDTMNVVVIPRPQPVVSSDT